MSADGKDLDAAVDKAVAQAVEQGFPPLVEDEQILDKLAVLSVPDPDSPPAA
jgi:hypothetical protein